MEKERERYIQLPMLVPPSCFRRAVYTNELTVQSYHIDLYKYYSLIHFHQYAEDDLSCKMPMCIVSYCNDKNNGKIGGGGF